MPLAREIRDLVSEYCRRDLAGDVQWHVDQFDFIADAELRSRLGRAFYTARFVAKLCEGLRADGGDEHPFVKFQIIQYASIYEAVISNVLWGRYAEHPEVKRLQTHKSYKPVPALGSLTSMTYDAETVYPCVYRDTKTNRNSIPFGDKVDCAVRIGFVEAVYAEDIKHRYYLRNLAHIENEADKRIEVELADAKNGYWRMKPFLDGIKTAIVAEDDQSSV
jgi:hypothetical protein